MVKSKYLSRFSASVVMLNTVANYAGNVLTALIALIFIPVYISYLGIGSYGVIGFFVSLQTFVAFLDLGIGIALNREMSRFYQQTPMATYLRNLAHSLQVVYWCIGIIIGIVLLCLSPLLSTDWFKGSDIPTQTLFHAFAILSLTMMVRWPYSLYSSGIRGMQHQVLLNVHDLAWGVVKSIGSWLTLKYYSPTLEAFLWFQFIATFGQTIGTAIMMWFFMPSSETRQLTFDKAALRNIGRYAAGMGAGALLSGIIQQLDKVLVSKLVTASQFGLYILASNVATLVYNASLPMYMALFPHFSKMAYAGNREQLRLDFHFYASLLTLIMIPFSGIIFFAPQEVLWLWTKDLNLATETAPLLQVLIAGTTFNALIMPVHLLLLAYNQVRFMLYVHCVTLVVMIPLTIVLVHFYGPLGGALAIGTLYLLNLIVQALLIFQRIGFMHLAVKWYFHDILLYLAPVLLVIYLSVTYAVRQNEVWTKADLVLKLGGIGLLAYIIAIALNRPLIKKVVGKFSR